MKDTDGSGPLERYYFFHLGCPKNLVDAERVAARLESAGMTESASATEADLLIVTTCAFISMAEEESVEVILRAASIKKPSQRLVVLGCLVSREGDQLDDLIPEVDIFLPVAEMEELPERLGLSVEVTKGRAGLQRRLFTPPHVAYIKVSEGCSNRCSYCTIPSIRGALRSRTAESILEEAQLLLDAGVKELVLIGQDTTAWGMEWDRAVGPGIRDSAGDIYGLAERIGRWGRAWVRLMYLHPEHVEIDRTLRILEGGSIVPYLDIPVQHSSDAILERMGRRYGRKRLLEIFTELRRGYPGVVLRTTVMTGFPGETQDDLSSLIDFLEEVQFDHVGVFEFSPERGTPASKMRPRVPSDVAIERRDILLDLQMDISQSRLEQRVDGSERVIVDRLVSPEEAPGREYWGIGRYFGQAFDIDGVTYLGGIASDPGEFVSARIVRAGPYDLFGLTERDLG